jgi:hypothetical protein
MTNKTDYVDLGLACADVCNALDRGMKGRRADEFSQSVLEAIEQLTTSVKPTGRILRTACLLCSQPQDRIGDPEEGHREGSTKAILPTCPREER